ncbi:MAG: bifunctional glutamate N-acetyltransferase/amino-acid acetyltransferase ArgJ [Chloroflexi bacterium]|jgi:glutamate N-acetyltransferase / amino-acid N-acetyltransferase|nr:bifunctional glutamate N-acetyltransferase/amino-acid acetyltransferase ArgJ [Chloroflexota bacterium]MBT7080445.1 bifunctional glutamate N-acetyltransferase/amino-acid acetyltransferase ArgJ [Chloroflexota bacterium]MBT7289604.1 bifunctional glutamate N-acetyltransferase/amino-acid acetyltransferase ArgJ [Chloroflexota bacterium]
MEIEAKIVTNGTVTTPKGFTAGALACGIKDEGQLDLGILYSQVPCVAAGVFTTNKIKAAPVVLSEKSLGNGKAQAVVVNAGCANACTNTQGDKDAAGMALLAAAKLDLEADDIVVASTGVIGVNLPMDLVKRGISDVDLTREGGHDLSLAIMTTDSRPKEVAVEVGGIKIGGIAKGAGMIHPNMATMLSFITTDADVDPEFLSKVLKRAVDKTFNMISVDGDTSTNDMVIVLANGLAGKPNPKQFEAALEAVCTYLAKCIAGDGEGCTRLIEVKIETAKTPEEARIAARTVASSTLVKTAMHSGDPNWGRIIAAIGRSGADIVESKVELYLNDVCILKESLFPPHDEIEQITGDQVFIRVCLNLGNGQATAWGCDLSEEYVTINSEYTT